MQQTGSLSTAYIPSVSPVKSKMKLNQDADPSEVIPFNQISPLSHANASSIAAYATLNQPVLDTTLKDMLLTLKNSIHTDIAKMMHNFTSEVSYLGDRETTIEAKMGEVTSSFNCLVDAQGEEVEDIE